MTKKKKVILLGSLVSIVVLIVCTCLIVFFVAAQKVANDFWGSFDNFDENEQPWEDCPIDLPDKTGSIVFLRQHSHPFLAEFNRKIRFEIGILNNLERFLPRNTGGQTKINVYYYQTKNGQGPYIELQDRYGKYCFDLGQVAKETLSIPDWLTGKYIGRLDGTQGSLLFISADESKEEKINNSN